MSTVDIGPAEYATSAPAANAPGLVTRVAGTVDVTGSTVNVAEPVTVDGTVNVGNTPDVHVTNTPNVAVTNVPDVHVTNTPTVAVQESAGALGNGAQTVVGAAAVQICAANANRKMLVVQNVGAANVRVGVVGVAANTGIQLVPGQSLTFSMPDCPQAAIYAIREGGTDSTVTCVEVT